MSRAHREISTSAVLPLLPVQLRMAFLLLALGIQARRARSLLVRRFLHWVELAQFRAAKVGAQLGQELQAMELLSEQIISQVRGLFLLILALFPTFAVVLALEA